MLILALDTALQRCSVAILRDGAVLSDRAEDMARGHAERLAPMAGEALAEAGVNIADLDRIGVVVGPGGFTGVRVALAFARGLAIGADIGVVGVTSLATLAGNVTAASGLIAPVIDARRGEIYAGLYGLAGEVLAAPFVAAPEQALRILVHKAGPVHVTLAGPGAGLMRGPPSGWAIAGAANQICAKTLARLAAAAPAPAGPPAPLYLRAPDAKPPKPGRFDGLGKA